MAEDIALDNWKPFYMPVIHLYTILDICDILCIVLKLYVATIANVPLKDLGLSILYWMAWQLVVSYEYNFPEKR